MSEMKEAQTNEMKLRGFDLATVTGLLRYIYAGAQTIYRQDCYEDENGEILDVEKLGFSRNFRISNYLSPQLMRLAHMYEIQDLVDICEKYLKEDKPNKYNKAWTANDIRKLADDLDNEPLKECSYLWLASDAFRVLECGSCKKRTKKPQVLLKCKHKMCGHLTDVTGDDARAIESDGKDS